MKTACIYHGIDLDGWMSAAIVKHYFLITYPNKIIEFDMNIQICTEGSTADDAQEIDFIGYNYGQPIPDLSRYNKIIMCDVSFPLDEMIRLREHYEKYGINNFIWIDHHISIINEYKNEHIRSGVLHPDGLRDTKFAACELTWKYFFHNKEIPEIVRLLGRYDCFGHKGTKEELKVLEFQYGARQCITDYTQAYYYLTSINKPLIHLDVIERIHKDGKSIYKYLCTDAKQSYKNGFTIILKESTSSTGYTNTFRKFICINKERFNPINFGIDYHFEGYDGAACFHMTSEGKFAFSLYNDNGKVDCSVIAKSFGGGGHRGAAGFICDLETFKNLIQ